MQYRVEMCRVYRCDRVYQWRQVLGVITVITQWYPMITNTSSASPWIPWPFPQPGLDVAPKGVACTPPGRAVSGCVRLCLSPTLCSSRLTAAILGVSWVKIEVSICQQHCLTSTTSTSLTYWMLQELDASHIHTHLGSKLHNQQYFRSLVSFYTFTRFHESVFFSMPGYCWPITSFKEIIRKLPRSDFEAQTAPHGSAGTTRVRSYTSHGPGLRHRRLVTGGGSEDNFKNSRFTCSQIDAQGGCGLV